MSLERIARDLIASLPSKDDQNRMVTALGAAALQYWKRLAQQKLRSTSRDYVNGLVVEQGEGTFKITLNGVLPNMIETGFRGGDMRKWMLRGPRVRTGKRGNKYLVIPFQHGTPGSSGRNVGQEMPKSIYEAARQLSATRSRPAAGAPGGRTVQYGERLTERSRGVGDEARKLLTTKQKPWHASSVFRGMIREAKTFKKTTQTTGYQTFRTISDSVIRGRTDAAGDALEHWYHPGIRASRFAQQTRAHITEIAGRMLQGAMKRS